MIRNKIKAKALFLLLPFVLFFASLAWSQITPDASAPKGEQPKVTSSANGVPVVNIADPNASGVSKNNYTQFDVNAQGAILNNSTDKNVQTQLGGLIQGNDNLKNGEARIILNQINSTNPSQLHGVIEVAGKQAEVVIANASGIICNGCTFINATKNTLTAGIPVMRPDGSIDHYRITGGTITIEGLGLDASTADSTVIMARAIDVNAAIWANYLEIIGGASEVDPVTGKALLPDGSTVEKPEFFLDVKSLGNITANSIYIKGSERGLGANNAGIIGAMAGDVVLDADGTFTNKRELASRGGNVTINATQGVENTGTIYAQKNTRVTSKGAVKNKGVIAAEGNTTLEAKTITNQRGAIVAAGINSDGTVGNRGDLKLTAQEVITSSGTQLSGGNQTLTAQEIDLTGSTTQGGDITVIATAGDLILAQSQINAHGALQASAIGQINNRQGSLRANEAIVLTAGTLLDNTQGTVTGTSIIVHSTPSLLQEALRSSSSSSSASASSTHVANDGGVFLASTYLSLNANAITGQGSLLSQGDMTLTITGDYIHSNELRAAGRVLLQAVGTVTNRAKLLADTAIEVIAAAINNTAHSEISAHQVTLTATNDLSNRGLINGSNIRLSADTLNNIGTGRIYGDHLAIKANTLLNAAENNQAGVIAARDRLDIGVKTLTNREGALLFSVGDFFVGGDLDANGSAIGKADAVSNASATLESLGDMAISAKAFNNTNERFATERREVKRTHHVEYQPLNTNLRIDSSQIVWGWTSKGASKIIAPIDAEDYFVYEFDRIVYEDVVTQSDPGKILAGKNLTLDVDNGVNDKSQILAGATLTLTGDTFNQIAAQGEQVIVDTGSVFFSHVDSCGTFGGDHCRRNDPSQGYAPPAQKSTKDFAITEVHGNQTIAGSGTAVEGYNATDVGQTVNPIVVSDKPITNNPLYSESKDPNVPYIIETDPRFTDYRTWVSSEYMLNLLGIDPATISKRMGDGFYEQQQLKAQILGLTGNRYLLGYSDDEAQFTALMERGVTYAKEHNLKPGVALSAQQMAELTSDMVWLVEKEVTLSNGETVMALVPELYTAKLQPHDSTPTGALLSGENVIANINELTVSGTLSGRSVVNLTADNITQLGGIMSGEHVALMANQDIISQGGLIEANKQLVLSAGNDITLSATTQSTSSAQGHRTDLDRIAGLSVTGDNGVLVVDAGNNLTLNATSVSNSGKNGSTYLLADNDLNIGTQTVSNSLNLVWDADNYLKESSRFDAGSLIQTTGNVVLSSGHNVTITGSSVLSDGAITALADGDLSITTGKSSYAHAEGHSYTNDGLLSSKTTIRKDSIAQTGSVGSTLSADSITLGGTNVEIKGSDVVATRDVTMLAENNLTIEAATNTHEESHNYQEEKSGILTNGGLSVTIGSQELTTDQNSSTTYAQGSTIGSLTGTVNLAAGNTYTQTGSDVTALLGDINIAAKDVLITAASNAYQGDTRTHFEQSGLTLSITNPIISGVQTGINMWEAANKVTDPKMQALAAGTVALSAKNTYDAVKADPGALGGVNISVSLGKTESNSESHTNSTQAAGSSLTAGGNINITAQGDKDNSDITIQGSQISADKNITLTAAHAINLLAASNTNEYQSKNDSKSSSVGIGIGVGSGGAGGLSLTLGMNKGDGSEKETSQTWTNTNLTAAGTLNLTSGSDTTIKGAVAIADQVIANIGGNLTIESLQESHYYDSKQQSTGGSLTIGSGTVSVSLNGSQSQMDSDFVSVMEQSGIRAGDGGFQVVVANNTELKGGVISSTDKAVEDNKNTLTTGTLTQSDIHNKAEYEASSTSIGVGYSTNGNGVGKDQKGQTQTGANQTPGSSLPSLDGFTASPPTAINADDKAESTTKSGISQATVIITKEDEQKALTGKDAQTTIAEINTNVTTGVDTSNALTPIFNKEEIDAKFQIVTQLTAEVGTFIDNRMKEVDAKNKAAKALEEKANDPRLSSEERLAYLAQASALYSEAEAINANWGAGGTYRQITTAIVAAASGNVSASTGEFVKNMVVNYVQAQGAEYIGSLVDNGTLTEGSPVHAALHSILACAGAAASNQNCGSAAMGAAAAVLLSNLLPENSPDESKSDKEAKRNLLITLVTGIAATSGVDTATATTAATTEVDNNFGVAMPIFMPPSLGQTTPQSELNNDIASQVSGFLDQLGENAKNNLAALGDFITGPFKNEGADDTTNKEAKVTTSVDDLIKDSTPGKETRGPSKQFERSGGLDQANKDFDTLNPSNVKDIPGGRVGTLEDGRTIIVRDHNLEIPSRPTLEIQDGRNRIKFRFND